MFDRIGEAAIPVVACRGDRHSSIGSQSADPNARRKRDAEVPPQLALVSAVDLDCVVGSSAAKLVAPGTRIGIAAWIDDEWLPVGPEDERKDIGVRVWREVRRADRARVEDRLVALVAEHDVPAVGEVRDGIRSLAKGAGDSPTRRSAAADGRRGPSQQLPSRGLARAHPRARTERCRRVDGGARRRPPGRARRHGGRTCSAPRGLRPPGSAARPPGEEAAVRSQRRLKLGRLRLRTRARSRSSARGSRRCRARRRAAGSAPDAPTPLRRAREGSAARQDAEALPTRRSGAPRSGMDAMTGVAVAPHSQASPRRPRPRNGRPRCFAPRRHTKQASRSRGDERGRAGRRTDLSRTSATRIGARLLPRRRLPSRAAAGSDPDWGAGSTPSPSAKGLQLGARGRPRPCGEQRGRHKPACAPNQLTRRHPSSGVDVQEGSHAGRRA